MKSLLRLAALLGIALEQVANRVVDGKPRDPQQRVQGFVRSQQTGVCETPRPGHYRKQKRGKGLHRIDGIGGGQGKWQMLPNRFAIPDPPQKLKEHHQPAEWCDRPLGLAQFHFLPAPKSGNFPMHCFVLLGVSSIQLKLNRVAAKQCYSISEFRFNLPRLTGNSLQVHCSLTPTT